MMPFCVEEILHKDQAEESVFVYFFGLVYYVTECLSPALYRVQYLSYVHGMIYICAESAIKHQPTFCDIIESCCHVHELLIVSGTASDENSSPCFR